MMLRVCKLHEVQNILNIYKQVFVVLFAYNIKNLINQQGLERGT